jgi:general secretion pathway protein H
MQILAAGSKPVSGDRPARLMNGFTLLELLVVLCIVGIAFAGVIQVLPSAAQVHVERDARRLAALLDGARAQSRTTGRAVRWQAGERGFDFVGLEPGSLPDQWLDSDTVVPPGVALELGPEPIIAPQSVTLRSRAQADVAWQVATDGLRPFRVEAGQADAGP